MQIVFVDTPGIHEAKHALGEGMNAVAQEALKDADLILWLVDVSGDPHSEDRLIAERLKDITPVIQVLNKIDLVRDAGELANRQAKYQKLLPNGEQVLISAAEKSGFDTLLGAILDHLPIGMPFYPDDQVTDMYEREIAADLIREAALNNLHDEIPHAIAVRIDEYKERDEIGAYITATIFVERASPERDRDRKERGHAQIHRDRRPHSDRSHVKPQGVPRPACQGQEELAHRPRTFSTNGIFGSQRR